MSKDRVTRIMPGVRAIKLDGWPVGERGGGSSTSENEILPHRRYLMKNTVYNIEDAEHREDVAENDARATALVYGVSGKIWSGEVYPYKREDKKRSAVPMDKKVEDYWNDYDMRAILEDCMICHNIHGHFFLVRMKYNKNGKEFAHRVYHKDEFQERVYDKFNDPVRLKLKKRKKETGDSEADEFDIEQPWIEEGDFIFFSLNARNRNRVYGPSLIKPVWDDIIEYQQMDWSMVIHTIQHAPAVPTLYVPANADDTEMSSIQTDFEDVRLGTSLLIIEGNREQVEFKYVSPETHAMNWDIILNKKKESMSTGTLFPQRWFVGDPKGALSAASEDGIASIQRLQELFLPWGRVIKEVNRKFIGVEPPKDEEWWCRPNYKVSDADLATIEKTKIEAIMLKAGLVPVEILWKELYPDKPLPKYWKENKDKPLSVVTMETEAENIQKMGLNKGAEEPDQNDKPARPGVKEKLDAMSDYELMKKYNMKKKSVTKHRQIVDDLAQVEPIRTEHFDSVHFDSIIDMGTHYEGEGYLMDGEAILPNVKEDGTVSHEINPPEEIKAMYERQRLLGFPLGFEHEGLDVKERQVGGFALKGMVGKRLAIKYRIDKPIKFPWLQEKIDAGGPFHFSAGYTSNDIPVNDGKICKKHTDLELYSAVITKQGKCGDTCSA